MRFKSIIYYHSCLSLVVLPFGSSHFGFMNLGSGLGIGEQHIGYMYHETNPEEAIMIKQHRSLSTYSTNAVSQYYNMLSTNLGISA